jgi:hypothetical protein
MRSIMGAADDVPNDARLRRAIHVTVVTPASQYKALTEFDAVVQNIEACRANEIRSQSLFAAWKGNPDDKTTCDACDAKTFCPERKKHQDTRAHSFPSLPSAYTN